MSKVKYRVREFTPKSNQAGTHSWFAEAVVANEISNIELSERIARRTGFKEYEVQAVVAAVAEVAMEEVLEGNRVVLGDSRGRKVVSLYPRVSGSISDAEVRADPGRFGGKQVAEEEMLTPEMLSWNIGSTVGVKYSRAFALGKQAVKVKTQGPEGVAPTTTPTDGGDEG